MQNQDFFLGQFSPSIFDASMLEDSTLSANLGDTLTPTSRGPAMMPMHTYALSNDGNSVLSGRNNFIDLQNSDFTSTLGSSFKLQQKPSDAGALADNFVNGQATNALVGELDSLTGAAIDPWGNLTGGIGTVPDLAAGASGAGALGAAALNDQQKWFKGYGIFLHYLPVSINGRDPYKDNNWNQTLSEFNVINFADGVEKSGASYVVFTVGQTDGFYASYNEVYENEVGVRSPEVRVDPNARDLVLEIGLELQKRGIDLIVYMAAEGPTAAKNPYNTENPLMLLEDFNAGPAGGGNTITNGNAEPNTRATINNMVEYWAKKWKGVVDGWWFDGGSPGSNYFQGDYVKQPDGQEVFVPAPPDSSRASASRDAANALINAAKSSDPNVLLTLNPFVERTEVLGDIDYAAGELMGFTRYPTFVSPQNRANQLQDSTIAAHFTSYLGNNWGRPGLRYTSEELARYIKNVNDNNGVVTVDVAIGLDGNINSEHLATMSQVRNFIGGRGDNAPPTGLPSSPNGNLAYYKPVYMINNSDQLQGRTPPFTEMNINGSGYSHDSVYAVDGKGANDIGNDTGQGGLQSAMPGGEYAWSLLVDLEAAVDFNQIVVTFPNNQFPTKVRVLTSNNPDSEWNVSGEESYDSGGQKTINLTSPQNARFVRLQAITPDGENQLGGQMAIREFQVFNNPSVNS
jgi:hypothetical protein